MSQTISGAVQASMFVSALLCLALPFALLLYFRNKFRAKVSSFLYGVLIFVLFSFILEQIPHYFFLVKQSPLRDFFVNNRLAYALYGAIIAGLFEETGRLVAYKFLMKKNCTRENALMYGAGHGGTEAILLGGITMVSNLILVFALNGIGAEKYIAMLPQDSQASMRELLPQFLNTGADIYLIAGIERIMALVAHIALSVVVFKAVADKKSFYFYPIAIGLHFLLNIPAGLYQSGYLSLFVCEAIMAVFVAGMAIFAYRLYHQAESSLPTGSQTSSPMKVHKS